MSVRLTTRYMTTLNAKVTSCDQRKSWILHHFFVIHVEATMERMLPTTPVVMNADTGKIIGQAFPIGGRVDTNIFDPATARSLRTKFARIISQQKGDTNNGN